jgi:hypothetical protein
MMTENFEKIYFDENIYCIENFLEEDVVDRVLAMPFEWVHMRNDFHQNIFNAWAPGGHERDYFKENVEDKIRQAVDNENQKLRSTSLLTKYVPDQDNCSGQTCGCQGYDLSWHYENHPGCDYESKWIRWGVVLYFNDDYEGGELVFEHKPVEIKPKRNSLMVFPASEEYSHAVKKVSGSDRVVFSGFVYARDYYELLNRSGLIDPLFVFEP